MNYPIQKTAAQWQEVLQTKHAEPGAFEVTATPPPSARLPENSEAHWHDGSYHCICCGNKLFDSGTKFDAGCGWPTSRRPCPAPLPEITDRSHGMERTETVCAQCGAHLGHVLDGPADGGCATA